MTLLAQSLQKVYWRARLIAANLFLDFQINNFDYYLLELQILRAFLVDSIKRLLQLVS